MAEPNSEQSSENDPSAKLHREQSNPRAHFPQVFFEGQQS